MESITANGQKTKYQIIKEAFIANPAEARKMYGKELSREKILQGNTLYLGNCVLKKECIKAMYDYIGFDEELKFIEPEANKKHDIHFTIGDINCHFTVKDGHGARILCKEDEQEKMRHFAQLLYPVQCIYFI